MKILNQIILLIGIVIMNTACADTKFKQPLYSLEFNIYGTGAEIRLNDIPIYDHDTQGETSSQKPIPESIIDGENTLTVKSFPLDDNDGKYQNGAYIEAIITVREKDAPLNESTSILQLKLNPSNTEDKLLDGTLAELGSEAATILNHTDKYTTAERSATIKSPFPRWAWQDGQIIEDTTENYSSLKKAYREIWEALNSADRDKVQKLYDLAALEFASAYHYQDKKEGHRIMNTGGLINDEDWAIGDTNNILKEMPFHLNIYANGRLANLIDDNYGKSPILYVQKKSQNIAFYKFGFYKNKDGEWIMVR